VPPEPPGGRGTGSSPVGATSSRPTPWHRSVRSLLLPKWRRAAFSTAPSTSTPSRACVRDVRAAQQILVTEQLADSTTGRQSWGWSSVPNEGRDGQREHRCVQLHGDFRALVAAVRKNQSADGLEGEHLRE
jgi:hypothetical protein